MITPLRASERETERRTEDRATKLRRHAATLIGGIGLAAAMFAVTAGATPDTERITHGVLKWTDASGRIHYGDRPPLQASNAILLPAVATPPAAADKAFDRDPSRARRSGALRPAVTLYTTPDCAPCDLARDHLSGRGVPFTEREVSEPSDALAFKALGFDDLRFPALSVGTEKLTGYQSDAWTRALDAGGYPGKSAAEPGRAPVERLGVIAASDDGQNAKAAR